MGDHRCDTAQPHMISDHRNQRPKYSHVPTIGPAQLTVQKCYEMKLYKDHLYMLELDRLNEAFLSQVVRTVRFRNFPGAVLMTVTKTVLVNIGSAIDVNL